MNHSVLVYVLCARFCVLFLNPEQSVLESFWCQSVFSLVLCVFLSGIEINCLETCFRNDLLLIAFYA